MRDVLTSRLADGHFMLARTRGVGAPWSAARHLHDAVRAHPRLAATGSFAASRGTVGLV